MDLILLQFYYNDNYNVGSHKKQWKYLCWHGITLYVLFVTYIGPDEGFINPKHVVYAFEKKI